ncbi:hypothetical protein F5Y09DRAFT_320347 [Xylaria sp. FL1042]|nr:hypothetical protein F5Y09DRAFT_320347 [Xylaria sp. FL1042]
MTESPEQAPFCTSDPQIPSGNEAQSVLKPILGFSSSRSLAHRPSPLQLPRTGVIKEDTGPYKNIEIRLSDPTYDLGLGNFGWLLRGDDSVYDDIDLQSEASCGEESCEEMKDIDANMPEEGDDDGSAGEVPDGQEFLDGLDSLEAARPKPSKRQITIPGNRESIWEKPNCLASPPVAIYSGWVDEIAELEASVSMPPGTRYYKVDDSAEADVFDLDG